MARSRKEQGPQAPGSLRDRRMASSKQRRGCKMLILPDSHAHPKWDNQRFSWAGNLLLEERPDVVVCLGDLSDFPSLSGWDRGKAAFEGRRYESDCKITIDAQARLFGPMFAYNNRRRPANQYNPRRVFLGGNHEQRAVRACEQSPELIGTLDYVRDLKLRDYWTEVHPYQELVTIEGFIVSHHLVSGIGGRPIGGINAASQILTKHLCSAIVGHSHLFDYSRRTSAQGRKLNAIVAGSYCHPDFVEDWSRATHALWDSGLVLLDGVHDGDFESLKFITMERIAREYK